MIELHGRIAIALVLYYAAVGIWGVVLAVRHAPLSPGYRGALIIGVGLGVVQAALGLALVISGLRPLDNLHFLYGAKADSLMHALRHLIVKARPTQMEVEILHGLARQMMQARDG